MQAHAGCRSLARGLKLPALELHVQLSEGRDLGMPFVKIQTRATPRAKPATLAEFLHGAYARPRG